MEKSEGSTVVILGLVGLLALGVFLYISTKGKNDVNPILHPIDTLNKIAVGISKDALPVAKALKPVDSVLRVPNQVVEKIPILGPALGSGTYDYVSASAANRLAHGDPPFYSATAKPASASAQAFWRKQALGALKQTGPTGGAGPVPS